ncbi:MAG: TatD family hydrolase [Oligoflexia bacterium]|nr:TatD family hydrolase [Oligoflexia bacterium]
MQSSLGLIDSHAHLDYEYDLSTDELIQEAVVAGVTEIVTIAAAPESLKKVRDLADRYKNIYFSTGIHPHDAKEFNQDIFNQMKALVEHPKCVAVGELGLDYYYDHSEHDVQKSVLKQQLDFSIEKGKPVIVHTREAEADTIHYLKEHAPRFHTNYKNKVPGIIHCFSGSAELAKSCLDLGYFLSFSGIITFKNADSLREIVKNTPLERILVETDSPYLAPIPHRGKKNHPSYTKIVAEKVAEIKGLTIDEVIRVTRNNTKEVFQLSI